MLSKKQRNIILATLGGEAKPETSWLTPLLKSAVEGAMRELAEIYESYNTKVEAPQGKGYTFGSGVTAGFGGQTITNMEAISTYKSSFGNATVQAIIQKAKADIYRDLGPLDYDSEKAVEILDKTLADQSLFLRLGAFYFAPDTFEGKGKHTIEVFAIVDFDGTYVLNKSVTTYTEKFTFDISRNPVNTVSKILDTHLENAINSIR